MKKFGNILVYIVIALFLCAWVGTMCVLGYNAMLSDNPTERISCFFALIITIVLMAVIIIIYAKFKNNY